MINGLGKFLAAAALAAGIAASDAHADIVISQVYGGGGNSGATHTHDFVELLNRGDVAVDLSGLSLQYASATGTGSFGANANQLTELSGSIAPGRRFLVQEAAGATPSGALPAPDLVDPTPINLSGSSGKIALVTGTTSLGCNTAASCSDAAEARILDLVGYGSANFYEGAGAAPGLSNATAAVRDGGGCQDTDDNAEDFAAATPVPRNSSAAATACAGGETPPPPDGTPLPVTRIHDVQGAGHISPLRGEEVHVNGIVTGVRNNGFYVQDTQVDTDPATSEGIFVFSGSVPAVAAGDRVDVTGDVAEYRPGANDLTITELVAPTTAVASSGHALPEPQLIGPGGRSPSTTIIEDDATDVEVDGAFDVGDGIDFYESLEGMRVAIDDAVAVGPTSDFGSNREIPVLPAGGAGATGRTARGGIAVSPGDFNPERVILNDLLRGGPVLPAADVRDRFPGRTVGVLDYNFSNFKLEVSALPDLEDGGLEREVAAEPGTGQLSMAGFNVENLDPGDPQAKFDAIAELIVHNLRAPDLLALEEVQDDNGPRNDAVVTSGVTYGKLADAIRAAGGPAYDHRQIDPQDDQDGGQPGGNIRVGFLFRTDRGLSFAERAGNPARIQPDDPAFADSRKPLVGEFRYDGEPLYAIANHWNSKGGDQPLYGRRQPPVLSSQAQRNAQARIVHDHVAGLLEQDPGARVAVLGDLNDFWFSEPLRTLTGEPPILEDLITRLPVPERYTYVFQGNSQDLDHALATPALAEDVVSVDPVHVNAEFADQVSDHDPIVTIACADIRPPALEVALSQDRIWPPNHRYVRVSATPAASDTVDGAPAIELVGVTSSEPDDAPGDSDGATTGDVRIVDDRTFDLRAERDETGPGRTYTVTYRAVDACGNAVTRSATVRVARM